jgi:hypothetical protein
VITHERHQLEHDYETPDPVVVVLAHRRYPHRKKIYQAECPLQAYLVYRPLREDWVVESMTYLNQPDSHCISRQIRKANDSKKHLD